MEDAIKSFSQQFTYEPVVQNGEHLFDSAKHIVLAGMGGSHLAAGVIKACKPGIEIYVHRSYDMPPYDEQFLKESLLVASSYSGNTEEVISFLDEGLAKGYHMAVIAKGGKLIEKAQEFNVPYIQMPDTGIQPRSALGYSTLALATMLGQADLITELHGLADTLDPLSLEEEGKSLAENLIGKVPVIYASSNNLSIVYNWKIKLNETAKIPAIYNVFPELNHNEMTSFDTIEATRELASNFRFVFLRDRDDHPRIQERMNVAEKLFEQRGYEVLSFELEGVTALEKIFNSLILADWTALHLSGHYGTEPEQVPMIEEFKKMISE